MRKKQFFKILLISFVAIMLRGILQGIIPTEKSYFEPSMLAKKGIVLPVLIIYGTVVYMAISYTFVFAQKGMSGKKLIRGIKFGSLFALMWIVYLLEPMPSNSVMDMIYYPVIDGVTLVILGTFLGKFVVQETSYTKNSSNKISILRIMIITLVFTIGRIIEYKVFNVNYSQTSTFVWNVAAGSSIGFIFECLKPALANKSKIMMSIIFGTVIFGVNLIFFNFFMLVIVKVNVLNLILTTVLDIVFITIGCFTAVKVKER
ncbi:MULTISPECIES: hypothetical protein [Clostridium]|uniref:hypothetical protein n=1 Tax=Clostridium TaxID=1485 RepID=UPI00082586F5|nr:MULTISPECIES: hypothetical protein [Clostridium]PJI09083.1 hypothetical protein CUB90_14930 [Clostridium sp. CT7]